MPMQKLTAVSFKVLYIYVYVSICVSILLYVVIKLN